MKTSLHELIKQIEDPNMHKLMLLVEVNLHQLQERSLAQSMVISWILSRYPDDEGLNFLRSQVKLLEDERSDSEVIAGFNELSDFLLSLKPSSAPEEKQG